MDILELLFLVIIIGGLFWNIAIELLNLSYLRNEIPQEFAGIYDAEKYKKSQSYLKDNTVVGLIQSVFFTVILLIFWYLEGFNTLDLWVRSLTSHEIWRGLIYIGALSSAMLVLGLPFSIYSTFVIEEKYGFNKTTPKTFVMDFIKSISLSVLLGGLILYILLWFFETTGNNAWWLSWIFVTVFQLFMMYIAPITIMPLFNKFTPLEEGELKEQIENFAQKQDFKLQGIFTMDGSKRSTKANAFFTGFGKYRRIVLFDTLIEKQSTPELVSVLAHEIGHYKRRHIIRQLVLSILTTGLTFYILSLFLNNRAIFDVFQMENLSIYASLVFFGIFYSPISTVISLYSLYLSRKYEFEADDFAKSTYGKPDDLISALKKLSVDSLSNLYPHPIKVFFEYTHPPILKRIAHLRKS